MRRYSPAAMEPDARHAAALSKIETLERENRELVRRLDVIGAERDALKDSRAVAAGTRYGGGKVVAGLALVILTVFGAAVVMFFQIRSEHVAPPADLPGTPHNTGVLGFPPPPPDPSNHGAPQPTR